MSEVSWIGPPELTSLLGGPKNQKLAGALFLLMRYGNNTDTFPDKRLFEICGESDDYHVVAKIVVATTAFSPMIYATKWMKTLGERIPGSLYAKVETLLPGVTLGIFQATNWLDQYWAGPVHRDFEKVFAELVTNLILNPQIPEQLELPGDFEGELANAIKTHFRPGKSVTQHGLAGIRLAHAQKIMENVVSERLRLPSEKCYKLSTLGSVILQQICYAVSGPMNPLAQAQALSTFIREDLLKVEQPASTAT